jgi:hypothetical protein
MRRDVEMHEGTPAKEVSMNLKFIHPVKKPDKVTYNHLAALARQGLGKSRLSPAEAEEVRAAVERHKQRQLAREQAPRDPLDKSGRFLRRLERILQDEGSPIWRILRRHYRLPSSRWIYEAGADLEVKIGEPEVYTSKNTVWHDRKPWRGTALDITLLVPANWRSSVLAAGLADAGGLLTLSATRIAEDAWEADWLVQGRGYEFYIEHGYIVRVVDGTYVHARTLKRARAIAEERAKAWVEKIRLRELRDTLAGMTREQIAVTFGDVPITINDSVKAGNCSVGTRQWCNKWADGRTSGTVRDALNTGAPLDEYLLRALTVAIARQHTNTLTYHIPQGQAMSL